MKYHIFLLVVSSFLLSPCEGHAQKSNISSFEGKLEKMQLLHYKALEGKSKLRGAGKNFIFRYDARINLRDSDYEYFILLDSEQGPRDILNTPHVEFTRMVADMASNDESNMIWARVLDEEEALIYAADWAAEARFISKDALSRYPEARLLCIYREGVGMASVLLCHNGLKQFPKILSFTN